MELALVVIGKIIRSHGLKGALKVVPLTDFPDRFEPRKRIILESPEGRRMDCTVASVQGGGNRLIVTCEEMTTVDEALAFVHGWVKIPETEKKPLPEGRYYQSDLIGTDVFTENGKRVGRVEDLLETGGNDVLIVRDGDREHLIPVISQAIRSVDIASKKIILNPMEGLVEDDAV